MLQVKQVLRLRMDSNMTNLRWHLLKLLRLNWLARQFLPFQNLLVVPARYFQARNDRIDW